MNVTQKHAFDIFCKALREHLKVDLHPEEMPNISAVMSYKLMNGMPVVIKAGSTEPNAIEVHVDLHGGKVTFAGQPVPTPPDADWNAFGSIGKTIRLLNDVSK